MELIASYGPGACEMRSARRQSSRITNALSRMSRTNTRTGTTIAAIDRIVARMSYAMLTGGLPTPAVITLTAGRTAAFLTR